MRQPNIRERYKARKRPDGSTYTETTPTYFTTIGGKTYGLGTDLPAAKKRYGELLAGWKPRNGSPNPLVAEVINRFLAWCGNPNNNEPSTCEWYRHYLESFKKSIGPRLRIGDLKKHHVTDWVDANYSAAKANTRNRARSCAKRALNWAVDEDLIERSPIAKCKMQKGEHRERYLEEAEWFKLLALLENKHGKNYDDFRDYLMVLWETGCRPQEARIMEARWFQVIDREAKQGRWVFPTKKSKGKQRQRIVYLTLPAFEITERLAAKFPEGPIFRQNGKPFDRNTIRCKFHRLKDKLGIPELCAYTLRHSWATKQLSTLGKSSVVVAQLMGHTSFRMLERYGHIDQKPDFLLAELNRKAG